MITEIGGTEFILITQQKTEKKVYIPVDRRVRAMLAKYDGKLPPVHPNEMNKLVKTIGLLLGWTHDCGFDEKRLNPKRGRSFPIQPEEVSPPTRTRLAFLFLPSKPSQDTAARRNCAAT